MTSTTTERSAMGTTDEVAAYLRMSPKTLIQMRYKGRAPEAARAGRQLLWSWADVDEWIAARKSKSPQRAHAA